MKNLKFFPCERNKYFYGKLLSVDDFESEQRYMNNKRRLINRFMHGCGVVCGLGIVPVDEDTISLEAGFALDFAGREIIVEKPVLKKLSGIEGFSEQVQDAGAGSYQYLCIEYAESEREPVYGMAQKNALEGTECYNKIAEGYRIYLTGQEPEGGGGSSAYYEEQVTLYWGNGIRISQVFPRYARSGKEFDVHIIVQNMGQKLPISFGYELTFDYISKDKKRWMKIVFDEREQAKSRCYEISVTLRAQNVKSVKGKAVLKEGSFWLKVGDYLMEGEKASVESTVEITEEEIEKVMDRKYFENAMQEVIGGTYHQSIYLAKIDLIRAGNTVVIDDVEPMPFGQYICSDVLSAIHERVAEQEQRYLQRCIRKMQRIQEEKRESGGELSDDVPSMETGSIRIDLGIGGVAGQKFFSAPVTHGLGLGNVAVYAGIVYGEKDGRVCYGAGNVFGEKERPVCADVAVRVDPKEGTFIVGIRLTEPTAEEHVTVHWTALRDRKEQVREAEAKALFIQPDMAYLSLRGEYCFEASLTGVSDRRIEWSVREAVGGTVDENGMYTAPNMPGIFEITAKSISYPELTASAFAVVRDLHQD
ncbi:MAG: hypothetical protein HDQ95_08900 [Roseburia sp.]|nr:hypothetical protein [Roseburia sp.]